MSLSLSWVEHMVAIFQTDSQDSTSEGFKHAQAFYEAHIVVSCNHSNIITVRMLTPGAEALTNDWSTIMS